MFKFSSCYVHVFQDPVIVVSMGGDNNLLTCALLTERLLHSGAIGKSARPHKCRCLPQNEPLCLQGGPSVEDLVNGKSVSWK